MLLLLFVFIGYLIALMGGVRHLENASWYGILISGLLAIGLYSSTYGIVLSEARKHARIILSAITVGVLFKAVIIGGTLYLISKDPFYLILGVLMAQIDPLSVSTLMQESRLSTKAKTILASWSSFDDPITVILALYVPQIAGMIIGQSWQGVTKITNGNELIGYVQEIGVNLIYAGIIFVVWFVLQHYHKKTALYGLVVGALAIATAYFWMLSVAVLGLFLRPGIDTVMSHAVTWALRVAALLLGMLLIGGVDMTRGVLLGSMTFISQIVVGFLLTLGLPMKDRLHLAFAQQNGITAIILALLFVPFYPQTVSVIAPAILVVNILHAVTNKILDRVLTK